MSKKYILDPNVFTADLIIREAEKMSMPVIPDPRVFTMKIDYEIPMKMTDEQMLLMLINTSMSRFLCPTDDFNVDLLPRGGGKHYINFNRL